MWRHCGETHSLNGRDAPTVATVTGLGASKKPSRNSGSESVGLSAHTGGVTADEHCDETSRVPAIPQRTRAFQERDRASLTGLVDNFNLHLRARTYATPNLGFSGLRDTTTQPDSDSATPIARPSHGNRNNK